MRIRCVLVAAALCACGGGDEKPATVVAHDAGTKTVVDSGRPDAGHRDEGGSGGTVTQPNEVGGTGGSTAPSGGSGGQEMVAEESGRKSPDPPPEGGKGGQPAPPMGGAVAPSERVLWSQDWTVEVHDAVAYGAAEGDTMGLVLDAGPGCVFGLSRAAPSGESQTFETDGYCITKYSGPTGFAAFFSATGQTSGHSGSADLVGWKTAVAGHTVKYLRRSQTYTIQLLGSDNMRWDYVEQFQGKWEAVGF